MDDYLSGIPILDLLCVQSRCESEVRILSMVIDEIDRELARRAEASTESEPLT